MSTKVAIVTGANKGLGFSIVKGLCEKFKGKVYLTSRDENRGKAACEELKKLGREPTYHQLDVTDRKSILTFRDHIKNNNESIDVLINNAGVLFLKDATEPKVYQAEQTLLANFFALVDFTEEMLPLVNDGGKIINISSSSGHLSRIPSEELRSKLQNPKLSLEELKALMTSYVNAVGRGKEIEDGWGGSPYVVSKNGVNAYTFMLHRRLADRGILVSCVHPGYVKSDMTRGAGDRSPEEAAEMTLGALDSTTGGRYIWHNGTSVPWDGPDPRGYIDGMAV